MKDVAAELNDMGIPTPAKLKGYKNAGTKWSIESVSGILKNKACTGEWTLNQNVYKQRGNRYDKTKDEKPKDLQIVKECPVIIPLEKWDSAQKRLKHNRSKPHRTVKGLEDKFLCKGLVYCGECGGKVSIVTKNHRFTYYGCYRKINSSRLKALGNKTCDMRLIPSDELDEMVLGDIARCIADPVTFAMNWFADADIQELESRIETLRNKIAEKEKLIEGAVKKDFYRGVSETAHKETEKLVKAEEAEKQDLNDKLQEALIEYHFNKSKADQLERFQRKLEEGINQGERQFLWKTEDKIIEFIQNLPYNKKHELVTVVIAPENGGKVIIRYPRHDDLFSGSVELEEPFWIDRSDPELKSYMNVDADQPPASKFPMVEMRYRLDLDRIGHIISGLKKKKLYHHVNQI